jgi:hypothetical protein
LNGDCPIGARRRRRCMRVQAELSKNATMFGQFRDGTRSFRPRPSLILWYSLLRILGCQVVLIHDTRGRGQFSDRWNFSSAPALHCRSEFDWSARRPADAANPYKRRSCRRPFAQLPQSVTAQLRQRGGSLAGRGGGGRQDAGVAWRPILRCLLLGCCVWRVQYTLCRFNDFEVRVHLLPPVRIRGE